MPSAPSSLWFVRLVTRVYQNLSEIERGFGGGGEQNADWADSDGLARIEKLENRTRIEGIVGIAADEIKEWRLESRGGYGCPPIQEYLAVKLDCDSFVHYVRRNPRVGFIASIPFRLFDPRRIRRIRFISVLFRHRHQRYMPVSFTSCRYC